MKSLTLVLLMVLLQACATDTKPVPIDKPRGENNFAQGQITDLDAQIVFAEDRLQKLEASNRPEDQKAIQKLKNEIFGLRSQRKRLEYQKDHLMDSE